MADKPSYNGIGSLSRTVLRITPKEKKSEISTEKNVTTQRPNPSTPSPRGHA